MVKTWSQDKQINEPKYVRFQTSGCKKKKKKTPKTFVSIQIAVTQFRDGDLPRTQPTKLDHFRGVGGWADPASRSGPKH